MPLTIGHFDFGFITSALLILGVILTPVTYFFAKRRGDDEDDVIVATVVVGLMFFGFAFGMSHDSYSMRQDTEAHLTSIELTAERGDQTFTLYIEALPEKFVAIDDLDCEEFIHWTSLEESVYYIDGRYFPRSTEWFRNSPRYDQRAAECVP